MELSRRDHEEKEYGIGCGRTGISPDFETAALMNGGTPMVVRRWSGWAGEAGCGTGELIESGVEEAERRAFGHSGSAGPTVVDG